MAKKKKKNLSADFPALFPQKAPTRRVGERSETGQEIG
jgi:hypothetical protein